MRAGVTRLAGDVDAVGGGGDGDGDGGGGDKKSVDRE